MPLRDNKEPKEYCSNNVRASMRLTGVNTSIKIFFGFKRFLPAYMNFCLKYFYCNSQSRSISLISALLLVVSRVFVRKRLDYVRKRRFLCPIYVAFDGD